MEYTKYLYVFFILSAVNCEIYGENLNKLFLSNSSVCQTGFSDTFRVTRSIDSDVLTPSANLSCIKSEILPLSSGGIIQVKVSSKSVAIEDYLAVIVYELEENNIVGQANLDENGFSDGQAVLHVILEGKRQYNGYITLIGKASQTSNIMVESVFYLPTQQEQASLLTPHDEDPDIQALQTGSILKYSVYPEKTPIERSFWIFDREDFWTPLTITLAVVIPVVILALLFWCCFALGKRYGAKQSPQIVYEDIDELPKPYLVPRVKSVYTESVASGFYGDTASRNNIYSV